MGRNGKTAAGKQRYRCPVCGASRSGERPDVSRRSEPEGFPDWLKGTSGQSSPTSFGAARSFRRRTAWCWNVTPRIPVTGEVHDQIQVDGSYDRWTLSDSAGSFSSPKLPVPDSAGPEFVYSND
ncbi:IS1/IS1595 family N-terminal zinc-binding domain-containing protein [Arthrobacter sp. 2MCAF14]|uniref:IS1/IS1595 family N-terminal zinc-binding domain-containing protein n=1 Tax=Arthrobacter sp. 2MCAF14 TaxID=3232982 RepID=UPI003F9163FF